ncbi:MAG TPA: hypothetical protein VGJ93_13340 [Desulfuromonadaceae bacterium]
MFNLIRKIKLDHHILFLLGFVYYLVIPPMIGSFEFLADYPGMSRWIADFNEITVSKLVTYFCVIFSYLISFIFGSFFIVFIRGSRRLSTQRNIRLNLNYFSILIFIAILIIVIKHHAILFTGYNELYDISVLGPLTTLSILQTYIVLYHHVSNSAKSILYTVSLITLFIICTIIMGLGSRMYVLIPIIALLIFKSTFSDNTISLGKYITLGVVILISMLTIGAWRIGATFDPGFYSYLFFAEPIFTWWSASTFLANNDLAPIALPTNFISSVLNFAPSFLFENKSDYLLDLHSVYSYNAPFGADSIFVSVQGNFGYVYGICYMFLIGLYFSVIKVLSGHSSFLKTYYILICAVLPFQFFRDSFSIINKQLFWNMLILPVLLYTISFCWNRASRAYYIKKG